jgi:hypothetical protein
MERLSLADMARTTPMSEQEWQTEVNEKDVKVPRHMQMAPQKRGGYRCKVIRNVFCRP